MIAVTAAGLERVTVNHAYVTELARKAAARTYQPPHGSVPRYFRELDYDTYRRITFRPEMTMWRDAGLRFQLQFNHPGFLFTQMVQLNEFTDTHSQSIPFARSFFDYHELEVPMVSRWGLNFAGFRILHPLNQPDKWDEVISFLGASFYRALGRNHIYGASARGLAINAGGPVAEEFPSFTDYWVRKPEPAATTITVHALLQGPSVAGAFTFVITPGEETTIDTKATLIFRKIPNNIGLVPLSSMFWFGEGTPNRFGDFRPEVHDSDGLLIAPDKQNRVWRPLGNPAGVIHSDYEAPQLQGFGLLQRDRLFQSYEDLEAHYERRPSVWIEPVGAWPNGRVRLVEMPAADEYHDNVTVYWMPKEPVAVGRPLEMAWRQRWTFAATMGGPPGWVAASRQSRHDGATDRTRFVIDYDPASLRGVPANAALVPEVSASGGAMILHSQVQRKENDGGWRLVIIVRAPPGTPLADVRGRLLLNNQPVTETWTYHWQP